MAAQLLEPQRLDTKMKIQNELQIQSNQMKSNKSRKRILFGLTLMFVSGILYSGLAALVRWGSELGYSSAEILLYRSSVQIIVALATAFKLFKDTANRESLSRKQIAAILGRGIFGAFSTFTYFQGCQMVPVGDCVTLKGLAAVFTSFAGWCILSDPLTLKHGIALLFAVVAAVLITHPPMIFRHKGPQRDDFLTDDLPGYLVSASSACFQCGVYICIKLSGKVQPVMLILSQGMFSCALAAFILAVWFREFHFFTGDVWQEYVCIICVCSIGYLAQYTLTRGGQILIAGLASLMRATDIAWAFLWGVLFFDEIPNYLTIIGGFMMFFSVLIITLEKINNLSEKNKSASTEPGNDKEENDGIKYEKLIEMKDDANHAIN